MRTNKRIFLVFFLGFLASSGYVAVAGKNCGDVDSPKRSLFIPDEWYPPISAPLGLRFDAAKFYKACIKHDNCYDTYGVIRRDCDRKFRKDLLEECARAFNTIWASAARDSCNIAAEVYYEAVVAWGDEAFEIAQRKAKVKLEKAVGNIQDRSEIALQTALRIREQELELERSRSQPLTSNAAEVEKALAGSQSKQILPLPENWRALAVDHYFNDKTLNTFRVYPGFESPSHIAALMSSGNVSVKTVDTTNFAGMTHGIVKNGQAMGMIGVYRGRSWGFAIHPERMSKINKFDIEDWERIFNAILR